MFKILPTKFEAVIGDDHRIIAIINVWNSGYYVNFIFYKPNIRPLVVEFDIQIYDSDYPDLRTEMFALYSEVRGKIAEDFIYRIWFKVFVDKFPEYIRFGNGNTDYNPLPKYCPKYWEYVKFNFEKNI